MKKEHQAGTNDEQRTAADFSTSASVEANPMLSAALSVEGNRLIAEFMKINVADFTWNEHLGLVHCDEHDDFKIDEDLQYYSPNTNWNDLMPVVEKISKIEFHREMQDLGDGETETIIYTHYPRTFGMLNNETENPMFRYNSCCLFEAETLIEAVWLATVDFIKNVVSVGSR